MTLTRIVVFAQAALVGWTGPVTATGAETTRTVYLSALDSKGAPVSDLKTGDLVVKEGDSERVIAGLEPATAPMDVAIIVDDGGSGIYQAGVLQFLQALGGQAQFSIRRMNPQAAKVLDYGTADIGVLQGALNQIGPRGKVQGDGGQLLEAISESARELQQRKAARRVILVLTVSGEGQPQNPNMVMDELQRSGAIMEVLHATGANIGLVTGDGPKQSGGRIERAGAMSAVPAAMTKITDALLHQYVLTYTLPDGVKPSDRLTVSTNRKGLSLLAPSRIPDK